MAEKIFHGTKPAAVNSATAPTAATVNPSFTANKPQPYNGARPVYRPQPHRSRRSCCCYCWLWIIFTVLLLIIAGGIAGGVLYLLYHPHRPTFSVSNLQVSNFNLTSSDQLTTRFNITVTVHNPNKKVVFYYDPVSVSINSNGVDVGDGTIPAFVTEKKNTATLRTFVSARRRNVDDNNDLKSDLKNKKSLPLKIELDSEVKVKIGSFKSKKVPVRVVCKGIKAGAPAGESATTAKTSESKCKVDLRIKIWKWSI